MGMTEEWDTTERASRNPSHLGHLSAAWAKIKEAPSGLTMEQSRKGHYPDRGDINPHDWMEKVH